VRGRAIRWAPWLAAAVLLAGIVAFAVTRSNGSSPATTLTPPHRAAPLAPAERRLATEFLNTAVARKRLERAWEIVAPDLKQGTSLGAWKTGSIPVVPYPVAKANALMRVVSSFTDRARLRVTFVPRSGTAVRPATFTLDLRNVDGHWFVSGWQPASTVIPPSGK
jgi:hypothetical protein